MKTIYNEPATSASPSTVRVRQLLEQKLGNWVPAWDLAQVAIEYKRPIFWLRHPSGDKNDLSGLTIENRTVRVKGKVHGFYRIPRYPGEPAPPLLGKPALRQSPLAQSCTDAKKPVAPAQESMFRGAQSSGWQDPETAGRR